ncbi:hypothetical protein [Salimicrobium jeotgali]|uniref:hypothetical protein n=1 Tax=Salimicrobium jeotgali TaxID=1230341 RepID=UPI000C85AB38|nr:hypothetical protein [Salimicrobium jeotgali]
MKGKHLWWIAGSLAAILLGLMILYISVYNILEERRTEGADTALKTVQKKAGDVKVVENYTFNSSAPFEILFTTSNDKDMIYYVNKKSGTIADRIDREDFVPREEIVDRWEDSCRNCSFTHIQPAYKDGTPSWEVTFTDQEGRYGLAYFDGETGEEFQRFAFKKNE